MTNHQQEVSHLRRECDEWRDETKSWSSLAAQLIGLILYVSMLSFGVGYAVARLTP